ncbi:threonyl-carbamoyl synthesis 4 [Osmia lignaria lignaria]|uniref:threonyl-carbamoyl synthesis 4 n=1 Tax=Osmia lignaria lignaria TaxID=1437193 RepID=UPI001478FF6B|nr:probable tRNA N6-adenosine threonylcarbamoyltransferase, mitochondrial [Osmia lignaria]
MTWTIRLFHKCQQKHFINTRAFLHSYKNDVERVQNSQPDKPAIILGVESSCDETGCGIVDSTGTILGEAISSQQLNHLNFGGIIPTIAQMLHRDNITKVCEDALQSANLKLRDVDAIATTVKPGIRPSLGIGTKFGKYLAKIGNKPFIPIHHMEAHALTARIQEKVDFPYLVLLISGGHCLLGIVESTNKFYLLGTTKDNAPGEVFDKIARRLKLRNIPEFNTLSGGQALEIAASKATDINQFAFSPIMTRLYDCNFSFAGIQSTCKRYIQFEEEKHNIIADMLIPDVYNLCAAFQLAAITHVCQRTQRAMKFIEKMSLFPENKRTLVISGGVACNNLLAKALSIVCSELGYKFIRTPPKLCTDNGIMIAWNGVEKWITGTDIITDPCEIEKVEIEPKASFGENWIQRVQAANVKCEWIPIKRKLY